MRRETANFQWDRTAVAALLAALTARPAAALLTTPTVRLLTSTVDPGGVTPLSALTEATFNGYAPVALTVVGPVNTPAGALAMLGNADFIGGGAIVAPGEMITGYMITDSPNPPTLKYGGELFQTPVPIANPGDALALDLYLPLPQVAETGQPQ